MRRALTRAFGAALVLLALMIPRRGDAADVRPIVRVVLVTSADAPPWFDGFVKHLERELGLRGIDVVVSRSERSVAGTGADAELVVDAPSALRPVLRFAVQARNQAGTADVTMAGHVRQVNLAGVPADGCALALAVAADELMRSNWPRAVPSEAARSAPVEGKPSTAGAEATTPAPAKATVDARGSTVKAESDTPSATAQRASSDLSDEGDTAEQGAISRGTGPGLRSSIGAAAAGEAFAGGQIQLGADLRWAVRVLPRLDIELRGGWRRILRQETSNGAIDGSALLAGGALGVVVLSGARANLSLVGRADLVRVVYSGDPRDATITATSGSAFGFVVAAGPRAGLALTRSLGLKAEILAGASPLATTATDAGQAVFATNGAAVLASLGLSLGL